MGWAAIDFETANADRASACALGLVVVRESQIVKRRSWLIRPSTGCFDRNYVMLHGITADQVAEMPTFAELWDEVHSAIQDMPLVAHNASFDIGVLSHTLDTYKIPYPKLDYYCTRAISQALWTGLPGYGLELVSHYLGLPFTHHAVEEDAMACAAIVLRGCSEIGVGDLPELAERLMIRRGHLVPGPVHNVAQTKRRPVSTTSSRSGRNGRGLWTPGHSESSQVNRSAPRFHLGGLAGRNFGSTCSSAWTRYSEPLRGNIGTL